MLPEQLRQRVKLAREVTQRLIKRGYQLSERADVLMREVEAALDALHETQDRPNRQCDEQ
jgi:ribosomal protein S16